MSCLGTVLRQEGGQCFKDGCLSCLVGRWSQGHSMCCQNGPVFILLITKPLSLISRIYHALHFPPFHLARVSSNHFQFLGVSLFTTSTYGNLFFKFLLVGNYYFPFFLIKKKNLLCSFLLFYDYMVCLLWLYL